jgi:putative ATP-binding cassette transporter
MAFAALAGTISGGCSVLLLSFINRAINSTTSTAQPAGQVIGAFVGLMILTVAASLTSQYLLVGLSQNAVYKLRLRISGWILSSPLAELEKLGPNKLLATLTEDVDTIAMAVFEIPFLCINIALILGCLAYLASLSWFVFLGVFCFIAIAVATVQFLLNLAVKQLRAARNQQDFLFKHLRAITDGIKELKLNQERRQIFFNEDLQQTAALARNYRVKGLRILAWSSSVGELMFFLILGLLVFGLPQLGPVPPALLSGYLLTITYLTRPLQLILQILPSFSRASIALQKIDSLGLALASQQENLQPTHQPTALHSTAQLEQHIQLSQVAHTYASETGDNQFHLGPIDLSLNVGELVFIVGGNGSGKSTLAKLITGLYTPGSGELYWDGQLVHDQNREEYRQLFSTVFADFYLFERLLGVNEGQRNAMDYLRLLQLDQKVEIREGSLTTLALSQGQRKRLALLSAYLEDRPIYLFDEWASDQDPFFREVFYQQLLLDLKQRGKTVLVISHDDRYFHLADRVIKLEYGQILANLSAAADK